MHRRLFKDTEAIIQNNYNFLNQIENVDEIYILGWSMSSVDHNYLKFIKNKLKDKKIIIHFTNYDINKGLTNFSKKIKKICDLNFVFGDFV